MRKCGVIVGTLFFMMIFSLPIAQAADEYGARVVFHMEKGETLEVGDVPGHAVGVIDTPGLIFITKGQFSGKVGIRKGTSYFDSVKGKGTVTAYLVYTFKDGAFFPKPLARLHR